jgi:hypothetical protein
MLSCDEIKFYLNILKGFPIQCKTQVYKRFKKSVAMSDTTFVKLFGILKDECVQSFQTLSPKVTSQTNTGSECGNKSCVHQILS